MTLLTDLVNNEPTMDNIRICYHLLIIDEIIKLEKL